MLKSALPRVALATLFLATQATAAPLPVAAVDDGSPLPRPLVRNDETEGPTAPSPSAALAGSGPVRARGPVSSGGPPLYDNGPFVNSAGTGVGGVDESVLQSSLGMTAFGSTARMGTSRLADDFTVPPGGWTIDQITLWSYQTGSTTTSTITGVFYRVWDGPPDDPASRVVFGDDTTNRLISSSWDNAYRVQESETGTNMDRPVMRCLVSGGATLPAGTYWLDWQIAGSDPSGPWCPPITITGQAVTGDALQFVATSYQWLPSVDGTSGSAQGFPFVLEGPVGTVLHDNGPYVNSPGTGVGGADESWLQNTSLLMGTYGMGVIGNGFRLADDFTVTDPNGWDVGSALVYAYQTASGNTSTLSGVNLRIWDGPPDSPASQVVFGDTWTNRMSQTLWTDVYRVREADSGANSDRPVMVARVDIGMLLPAGTYWLDWQVAGMTASGPFAPPITINGQTTTGDALQYTYVTAGWQMAMDNGSMTQQGFPFILEAPGACAGAPGAVQQLVGFKDAPAAVWSWSQEPDSLDGYNLYSVTDKTELDRNDPNKGARGSNPNAVLQCPSASQTMPTCTDPDALDPGSPRLYYEVVGVCGGAEGAN